MKVAVLFSEIPQAGGAFHQSIAAIEQFKRVCGDRFEIELFHPGSGADIWLDEIGLKSTPLRETWWSKVVEATIRFVPKSVGRRFKIVSPREKFLLDRGVDLVYFASPNMLAMLLRQLNYVVTLYDLCHRDFPEFPEVRELSAFESRESYNAAVLAKAILVVADSNVLKLEVCRLYGVHPERVLVMPYSVSHYIDRGKSDGESLRRRYKLQQPFLFYPAQFWAHKNHIRILQALSLLKERGISVDVAFSGSDKGRRVDLEAAAVRLGIADRVHFLGFIPSEDLAGLYSESIALVMPTYLGPTNIPPLEAWSRDVPVIYSKHLSADIEDSVLAIDPDSPESVAQAIEKVTEEKVRQALVAGGRRSLDRIRKEISAAESAFQEHLVRFSRRRETWRTPLSVLAK